MIARSKNERPRISNKEAERVSIPTWPKIHQLDNWKMPLLMNVLSACADPDTDTWTKWLEQALGLNPDSDSGGDRFATIDIKMAMGMQNMLRQAPDEAKDVYLDATRHSELRHQQGVIVKGRELVALVMQSFRTSDRTDLVYHIEHLLNLDFPGDKNLVVFRNKWYDLLLKMRSEDRPSTLALRDILYRKIKGSKKMEFGLNAYHRLPDKHPQKSYEFLLALINHQIKSHQNNLTLDMKEKSVKPMMKSGGKDAAPAAGKKEGRGGKGKKDPMLPLCSQRPKQRVTLARTASPMVPTTEARVRAETMSILTARGLPNLQLLECPEFLIIRIELTNETLFLFERRLPILQLSLKLRISSRYSSYTPLAVNLQYSASFDFSSIVHRSSCFASLTWANSMIAS